jgi:hypothetical protein
LGTEWAPMLQQTVCGKTAKQLIYSGVLSRGAEIRTRDL